MAEQYIAVTAGWGLDAQGVQNGIDKLQGTTTVVPKAGTLWFSSFGNAFLEQPHA